MQASCVIDISHCFTLSCFPSQTVQDTTMAWALEDKVSSKRNEKYFENIIKSEEELSLELAIALSLDIDHQTSSDSLIREKERTETRIAALG